MGKIIKSNSKYKGKLITLEGIDGSGKSTQIAALAAKLSAEHEVLCLREPGGSTIGEQIRQVILSTKNLGMNELTELLLFEAARVQMMQEKIIPALEQGQLIICDRFTDSTTAYQAFGRNIDQVLVEQLNSIATGGCKPDLTILLDISVEEAATRMAGRGEANRLDREKANFMQAVRDGYLSLAAAEPERFVVIDASQNSKLIAEQIGDAVEKLLGNS